MKKIIPMLLIVMLVLSGLGASELAVEKENISNETNNKSSSERTTHTVLGEYGTSTTCGYCKYAHGALKELYAEGQLDFYYITYVCNKNPTGYSYCKSHYNLYGYPTLWWDGGRDVDVGASSIPGAKSTYTSSINYVGNQAVKDVDIDLTVTWLGGTEMEVDCTVTNNEANTYGGTIQVAICEKESSRGWRDTAQVLYTMVFLDWAFKEPLSISSGGSWSDSMTWDGASHGYSTVTERNTIVIAAAYNDEWHQGYSYPPSTNPFDAYYVDDTIGWYLEVPDLDCDGSLSWTDVEPGANVAGTFTVENIGDPLSLLDWEIESYPDWGTFTFDPDGGLDLTPEAGAVTVTVDVVAPEDPETEFEGEIVLVNSDDPDDVCVIDVSLATPVSQQSLISLFFEMLAQRFPILGMILAALF